MSASTLSEGSSTKASPLAGSIEVLICTFGRRVDSLAARLPANDSRVTYLVSHQCPDGDCPAPLDLLSRADVRYLRHSDRGLSINRNHALDVARGEICLIADDDIELLPGWIDALVVAFGEFSDVQFASFASIDESGRPRRKYPALPVDHNRRTIYAACSVEIAFRLAAVRNACVRFDQRLGVGGVFPFGEELVFLRDLIRAGCKGRWVPTPIVRIRGETTGTRMQVQGGLEFARAVGAMSYCRRGAWAYPLVLKEAVRLAMLARSPTAAPALGWAWWVGAREARRLGLGSVRSPRHRSPGSKRAPQSDD